MTRFSRLMQSGALAMCLPASSALADLTAVEVWTDWKDMLTSSGYTLNASQASTDDSVTVSDLSMQVDISEGLDKGMLTVKMGTLRFVEKGDGSVTIEVSDTTDVDFSMTPEVGESVSATINATMAGQVMTASGEPNDITYDFSAIKTDVALNNLTVAGETLGQENAKAAFSFENLAYVTRTVLGELRTIEQTTSAGAMNYEVNFSDPASTEAFKMNGGVRDIAFSGGGALPLETDTDDANALLNAGLEFAGKFTTQGGNYDLTFSGEEGNGTVNTTSEGAEFIVSFAPSGFAYEVAQRGVTINMLLAELPLPISFSAAELAANVLIPIQKSDQDQDFAMGLTLDDLTISDAIWGIFDPTAQLPRTPANLIVDLSGTVKVLFDFLDPAQAEALSAAEKAPGEVNTLALNTLELDAAGARLTGKGDFRFDNSDLTTFEGFPRPEGGIDLTLTGGNVLLDKLVDMGLLPQDQAMGTRMMMGLFAVPVEGEDTLNSRIEVTPEGQVMANGQRLR